MFHGIDEGRRAGMVLCGAVRCGGWDGLSEEGRGRHGTSRHMKGVNASDGVGLVT